MNYKPFSFIYYSGFFHRKKQEEFFLKTGRLTVGEVDVLLIKVLIFFNPAAIVHKQCEANGSIPLNERSRKTKLLQDVRT